MSTRFLSDDWYRVAGLRPRLLAQVSITRQRFRGKAWYVLLDQASGAFASLHAGNLRADRRHGRHAHGR
jgi:putative peptide zinc metalloprotease protein